MATKNRRQKSNYVVTKENGEYVARCDDLGLTCRGATEQEAAESLEEALALYFEDLTWPGDG